MKVLFAGPYDTKGRYSGGISYIVNTVYQNKELGELNSIELLAFNTCKVNRSKSNQGKLNLNNLINSIYILKDLKKIIKSRKADIVYYNSSYGIPLLKDLMIIKIANYRSKLKTIIHIHFAEYEKILPANRILKKITFRLLKNVDHIVFLSEESRKEFVRQGIPFLKTSVIYNFHNIEMNQEEFKNKIQRNRNTEILNLVYMGSIDKRKGIIDLLNALQKITQKYSLCICGETVDDEIRKEMDRITCNLPPESVELKGFVTGIEKERILMESDVLILPSYGEGFPIVLLEGIATANYIITTSVGAIPEVFGNDNGVLVSPGNIDELATAIKDCSLSQKRIEVMEYNYSMSKRFKLNEFINSLENICNYVMEQ